MFYYLFNLPYGYFILIIKDKCLKFIINKRDANAL